MKLNINISETSLSIFKISGLPPTVIFTVIIGQDFKVTCYNYSKLTSVRHLLGFSAKLEKYSQLNKIIESINKLSPDLNSELISCSKFLADVTDVNDTNAEQNLKIRFLCDQMELSTFEKHGARYPSHTMRESINLYLRSRNAYDALRYLLVLPHERTIKNYFGKLGSADSVAECSTVTRNVFEKLEGVERHCKILVDEIHIKPGIQYQGGHLIGFSADQPDKAAKSVLALMIAPLMGKPAFVARLIPIFSLNAEFLYDQINQLTKIIHEANGFVYLVMTDNLKCNQSTFSLFH